MACPWITEHRVHEVHLPLPGHLGRPSSLKTRRVEPLIRVITLIVRSRVGFFALLVRTKFFESQTSAFDMCLSLVVHVPSGSF